MNYGKKPSLLHQKPKEMIELTHGRSKTNDSNYIQNRLIGAMMKEWK
jgi:hypothetical protein